MQITNNNTQRYSFPGAEQKEKALARKESAKELDTAGKKVVRKREDKIKQKLLELEKDNFTKIYAMKCYNGWLKICNNSAVILSTWLDGKLGRRYELHKDEGYGVKAEHGAVSVPPEQIGDLVLRLDKVGIKLSRDGENFIEFELGEKISQEDMVFMLHEDELLVETTNKLVMPKAILVNLRTEMKNLLEFVHVSIINQKKSTKEIYLSDVERRTINASKAIIATARGRMSIETCLKIIGKFTEEAYEDATIMCDLKLITAKQYKTYVDLIRRVESEHAREIKRQLIEKAKKETEKSKIQEDKNENTINN